MTLVKVLHDRLVILSILSKLRAQIKEGMYPDEFLLRPAGFDLVIPVFEKRMNRLGNKSGFSCLWPLFSLGAVGCRNFVLRKLLIYPKN